MNEHFVSGFELRPVEGQARRQRRGRDGGGLHRAHAVRDRGQQLGRHVEPAGESALHEPVDALADLEVGDTAAQLRDDAGEVTADGTGVAW